MKSVFWVCSLFVASCLPAVAAAPIVGEPIVPSDPDAAGRELAAQLRSLRPVESMTNTATLSVYSRRKLLRKEPLEIVIWAGSTNWSTTYRLNPGASNQTELCITRSNAGATQYRLRSTEGGAVRESTPSGAELMVPFGDSEFWLADLGMEFLQWPTQRLLRKEIRRSQSCDKLESLAPDVRSSGYLRVVGWYDIDTGGPVIVEAYDSAGKMVKEFKPNDFKKVDGQWQVEEVEISNIRARTSSTIHFDLGVK